MKFARWKVNRHKIKTSIKLRQLLLKNNRLQGLSKEKKKS